MDPKKLIEQFMGSGGPASSQGGFLGDLGSRIPGGAMGGLAAGGLLGMLLGNKKVRKMAGGVVGYGGAAALGALALKAWQNYQENQTAQTSAPQPAAPQPPARLQRLAADGRPFELALVRAMISAANADGHIGPDEHRTIFEQVQRMALDSDDKAFVFDALAHPLSANELAALAGGADQASEIWLASRLAIDPDDPKEQAYLQSLASALNLPHGLTNELERQLDRQQAPAA